MSGEWTESGGLPGEVVLSFEGIDRDAVDAREMKEFMEGVNTTSADAASSGLFGGGTMGDASTSLVSLVMLSWMGAMAVAGPLAGSLAVAGVAGSYLGVKAVRDRRFRARHRENRAFSLALSDATFTVRADGEIKKEVPLADIEGFAGGRRLAVRTTDGRVTLLAPCLFSGRHAALAARLDEILADARRARVSSYR